MAIRLAVIEKDPLCRACTAQGRVQATQEVDHIIALEDGGSNEMDNLQGLCIECHKAKTTGKAPRPRIGVDGWPDSSK